jgi:short-subunit dehydrogenase
MPRTILITGATSGIGRALALRYAKAGARLGLIARDRPRLQAVAEECAACGIKVIAGALDVRDRRALSAWISDFDEQSPVNLVFANAGVMAGTPPGELMEPRDEAYNLMTVNVLGVQSTVDVLLPRMMERGEGTIALMSSLAAFVPLPDAPSYSASKAAILTYGLSLRHLLRPHGIRVSVICPGHVDTAMSARETGRKPFKISAEKAAKIIETGLDSDRAMIVFPRFYGWLTRLAGVLPDRSQRWVLSFSRFNVMPSAVQDHKTHIEPSGTEGPISATSPSSMPT